MNRLDFDNFKNNKIYSKRHTSRKIKCTVQSQLAEIVKLNSAKNNSACTSSLADNSLSFMQNSKSNNSNDSHFLISGDNIDLPNLNESSAKSLNETDNSNLTSNNKIKPEESLKDDLKQCFLSHNITHSAINDILKIFQPFHRSLPLDARTLMLTPSTVPVLNVDGGTYVHFDLKETIIQKLNNGMKVKSCSLLLHLHIDGIPIFKSSISQFWPILGCLKNTSDDKPFVLGIFLGKSKPVNVEQYLKKTIGDLKFCKDGFSYIDQTYTCNVEAIICDTPARAFVTCAKLYTGYYGCDKCRQKGRWCGRMTFPELGMQLRTDEDSFNRNNSDGHFLAESPFEELKIGLISKFPLDYMHLVCLGVVRKLIVTWCRGSFSFRLSLREKNLVSQRLLECSKFIPIEFQRKPKSLKDIDRWKATELRQFLLYTGPVVLKKILSKDLYDHFLLLHFAMRILTSEKYADYFEYAGSLLDVFVAESLNLYGSKFLTYNVHCLSHLISDVRKYGKLDNFSAFKYESYLGKLKRLVRSYSKPLQQVYKRIKEKNESTEVICDKTLFTPVKMLPPSTLMLKLGISGHRYLKIEGAHFILKASNGDNIVLMDNGDIVKIKHIILNENELFVLGKSFEVVKDFYVLPCESSNIQINWVSKLSKYKLWQVDCIKCKCFILPYKGNFVSFPIIHLN